MPKVSFVLPSLNVVKYIGECIESVLNQTLEDIEILPIDAGSEDGTWELLNEYAKKDNRVKCIKSDKRSYGYQVNLGVKNATGEYICIVETDDYIEPDIAEYLYSKAKNGSFDFVKGVGQGFCIDNGKYRETRRICAFSEKDFGVAGEIEIAPCDNPELVLKDYYLWTGMYKKDFIDRIIVNETPGAAYQDIGFQIKAFSMAKKALFTNKLMYHYRQDNSGCSSYSEKAFGFLFNEYSLNKEYTEKLNKEWNDVIYTKYYLQTITRVSKMAEGDKKWSSYTEYIGKIIENLKLARDNNTWEGKHMYELQKNECDIFLSGEDNGLYYFKELFARQDKNVQEMNDFLGDNTFVIFGTGIWGGFLNKYFSHKGNSNLLGYCDNNKGGKQYAYGLKVYTPEEVIDELEEFKVVVAVKYHFDDIKAQLLKLGIKEEDIFVYEGGTSDRLLNWLMYVNEMG